MKQRIFLAAIASTLVAACGGGGGGGGGGIITNPPPPPVNNLPDPATAPSLDATLAAKYGVVDFPIGAAIEVGSTAGAEATLLQKHFSSITAENVMKPATIQPSLPGNPDVAASLNFVPADQLVAFAEANNMQVRGHTLLWHQTAPSWFFAGDVNDPVNYRIAVQQRLRDYIFDVIQHFGCDIYAWDVVNEVASDTQNAANPYRTTSPWYQAYAVGGMDGADYIADAFTFAAQARATLTNPACPDMKLMLNDYNTELAGKRANVMQIVQSLLDASVPIDGVGHQFHLQGNANVADVTAAFVAVETLVGGSTLVNHVTELDVSIYSDPGDCFSQRTIPPCQADYGASPPQSVLSNQATLYRALFNAFDRPSVTSITLWGLADNHTWLNSFPVNRTNRPLLFDTNLLPKWAFWAVVDPAISIP